MTNKQQILDKIQAIENLEQEVKDLMVNELTSYPAEMSKEDVMRFDGFVSNLQEEELMTGQALQEFEDTVEKVETISALSEEVTTNQSIRAMVDGLQDAQALSSALAK